MEVSGGYKLRTGAVAPTFDLPGVDGKRVRLQDLPAGKPLVVLFWCNHCPYVRAYEDRVVQWAREVLSRGDASIVAINSNDAENYPEDDFPSMVDRAKRRAYPFPYLRDEDQSVARAYGAECTPHFLLFDGTRRLAYQGRFDDHKDDPAKVTRRYLPEALAQVLAGRRPAEEDTWAIGCSIKWSG